MATTKYSRKKDKRPVKKLEYPYPPVWGEHKKPKYRRDPCEDYTNYYVDEKYYGTYATSKPPKYVPHALEYSVFHPSPDYYDPPLYDCETTDPDNGLAVRVNQNDLNQDQQNRFLSAYQQLISSNFLGPLVIIHSNAAHMMHSNPRFLPWHRVYLKKLEDMLQTIDPSVTIPYWRSSQDQSFPGWLGIFLPTVNGHTVTRSPGGVPLPDVGAVNSAVNNNNTFNGFAQAVEGIHNTGHVWVGGSMSSVANAPCDPVFWMHHAEIDRIWAEWQALNPGVNPNLTGSAAIMDPWSETEPDTRDTAQMGYIYS